MKKKNHFEKKKIWKSFFFPKRENINSFKKLSDKIDKSLKKLNYFLKNFHQFFVHHHQQTTILHLQSISKHSDDIETR